MTVVLAGALVIGFAVAGRAARRRWPGWPGWPPSPTRAPSSRPRRTWSTRCGTTRALTRQQPGYSLPLIRLVLPTTQQMFGVTPLVGLLQSHRPDGNRELRRHPAPRHPAAGWPASPGAARLSRLLLIGFALVIALAVGPNLVVTSTHHTCRLPWAGLWNLPLARSAEPSRFIVFARAGPGHRPGAVAGGPGRQQAACAPRAGASACSRSRRSSPTPRRPTRRSARCRWATSRRPPCTRSTSSRRSSPRAVPAVPAPGRDRRHPHAPGNAGMLFQAAAGFYFRIAGGYINASLTPVNALPPPSRCSPIQARARCGSSMTTSAPPGVGAIVVEQAWEEPWMNLGRLGMHGHPVGRRDHLPDGPLARQPGARAGYPAAATRPAPLTTWRSQVEDEVLARLRAADERAAVGGVVDRGRVVADLS